MKRRNKLFRRLVGSVLFYGFVSILTVVSPGEANVWAETTTFYLHDTGPNSNPPTLTLNKISPADPTSKYKDSPGINFAGGNPWREIGTWTAPAMPTQRTLTGLSSLHVWLGLKNSDDIGTQFDLRAEVYKNNLLVAAGDSHCITGVTQNPDKAKEVAVPFAPFSFAVFDSSDVLSLKILTRVGTNRDGTKCPGHSNAQGLRLYFDAVSRPSRFDATLINGVAAVIGPAGGIISANNGIQAFIPPGATDNNIVVAVSYVSPDQLRIDPSEGLGVLGAVNFNIGDAVLKIHAELTIPKPSNLSGNPQIYLGKIIPLGEKDLIAMVDTASVQGNSITTNSPAIYGALSSGTFAFYTNNTACGVPDYNGFFAGKINPTCTDKLYLHIYLRTEEPILLAQNQNLSNYINGALTFNDRVQSVISIADTMATLNGLGGASVEELIADADSEMSEFMANVYGGYWDILALWIPLITCPFTGSCAQELAVTVGEMWFNAWAATQVIYLGEEMNNNLVAIAFLDRYYSYGRNQTLVAQSLGLAPGADMDSIVNAVAQTQVNDPWWWPFPSYDVSKIKNIISSGQQWVEAIYKALPTPPGGPWLSFIEGNPGIPGDGVTVRAGGGIVNRPWFELSTPISLGQFPNGFTITIFPLGINIITTPGLAYMVGTRPDGYGCTVSVAYPLVHPTVFNGINGFSGGVAPKTIQDLVNLINTNGHDIYGHRCNVTANDLLLYRLGFFSGFSQWTIFYSSWVDLTDPDAVFLTRWDAAAILP